MNILINLINVNHMNNMLNCAILSAVRKLGVTMKKNEEMLKVPDGKQAELRNRLFDLFKNNPQSLRSLGKEINVAPLTLARFLRDKLDVGLVNYFKILKFVEAREKEQK